MSAQRKRKTLTSSVKKDLENKEKIVENVLKHVQDIKTEHHNAIIPEKEKATFYINKNKLEHLEDISYKLKKEYPAHRKRINKSTVLEMGLDLILEECENKINSGKILNLLNN